MRANATTLTESGREAFDELVRISHLRRRRRATFRDLRSASAWVITGDRSCADVHTWRASELSAMQLDEALVSELAFSPDSNDYLVAEWAELDPAQVPAPGVDGLFRTQGAATLHPVSNGVDAVARGLYFGLITDEADRPTAQCDELPLPRGVHCHADQRRPERTRDRLLLGMSRLVGAFGYTEPGLAHEHGCLAPHGRSCTWCQHDEFDGLRRSTPSPYIETIAGLR